MGRSRPDFFGPFGGFSTPHGMAFNDVAAEDGHTRRAIRGLRNRKEAREPKYDGQELGQQARDGLRERKKKVR